MDTVWRNGALPISVVRMEKAVSLAVSVTITFSIVNKHKRARTEYVSMDRLFFPSHIPRAGTVDNQMEKRDLIVNQVSYNCLFVSLLHI